MLKISRAYDGELELTTAASTWASPGLVIPSTLKRKRITVLLKVTISCADRIRTSPLGRDFCVAMKGFLDSGPFLCDVCL